MLPSHDILLHEAYRKAVRKLFRKRKDKELERRLQEELSRLRFGPGNNDTVLKGIRAPALRGKLWRRRVGRHRLVYMLPPDIHLIFPIFLSPRPRNGYGYDNLDAVEEIAEEIILDFENRRFDKFERRQDNS